MKKTTFLIVGKHAVLEALKNPSRKIERIFLTEDAQKKLNREKFWLDNFKEEAESINFQTQTKLVFSLKSKHVPLLLILTGYKIHKQQENAWAIKKANGTESYLRFGFTNLPF